MTSARIPTASVAVRAIRSGTLRVTELADVLLGRIERLDQRIHAWVAVDREGALARARQLDDDVQHGRLLPLHGLPIGVKDVVDVAGLPTRAGYAPYARRPPAERDAAIVEQFRSLGAVILGKTETTQFAHADPAPTRNPWNLERTPGGSSSGSAAAVAAGMTLAAIGTQTAGSVLRPAAFCGVVGFKPSFNWMPREGVIPLAWSLDHLGLLTRSVEDAALIYGALVGAHVDVVAPLLPPRIGLLTAFLERAQPAVAAHLNDVANRLNRMGADVRDVDLPVDIDLLLAVHATIMQSEVAAVHAQQLAADPASYGPRLRADVELGQLIPAVYDIQARRHRRWIGRAVDRLFDGVDVLLLPTVSDIPPGPDTTGDPTFQAPWTLLGTPAVSLPTGLGPTRLPIASQLVGRRGDDAHLLAIAAWCERALGTVPLPALD